MSCSVFTDHPPDEKLWISTDCECGGCKTPQFKNKCKLGWLLVFWILFPHPRPNQNYKLNANSIKYMFRTSILYLPWRQLKRTQNTKTPWQKQPLWWETCCGSGDSVLQLVDLVLSSLLCSSHFYFELDALGCLSYLWLWLLCICMLLQVVLNLCFIFWQHVSGDLYWILCILVVAAPPLKPELSCETPSSCQ